MSRIQGVGFWLWVAICTVGMAIALPWSESSAQIREQQNLRVGDISLIAVPDWLNSTAYSAQQVVLQNGFLYRRGTAGTSGVSFDPNDWVKITSGIMKSGTPADNRLAVWKSSTQIEGEAGLTYNATTLLLSTGGPIQWNEVSSDPGDPAEGKTVAWTSDGTGFGDDGDVVVKITAGGVTKTHTLIDFSAISDEEP